MRWEPHLRNSVWRARGEGRQDTTDGQTETVRQIDGQTNSDGFDRWTNAWMDGWTDGGRDGWMDACMHGWMDGWIDRSMDGPQLPAFCLQRAGDCAALHILGHGKAFDEQQQT